MRPIAVLTALVVLCGACSYESSGTTTTTFVDPGELPPATGPADIVMEDQDIEGGSVIISSVTLPSDGWVVVRGDDGGAPGEMLGISSPLKSGLIASVQVPFFVPIEEAVVLHASVHIDADSDGVFSYEPPEFIDPVATTAAGEAAMVSAHIGLLPPLDPADAAINEQRTDGSTVFVAGVTLPAPGFVAIHRTENGEPGAILAFSELLAAGTTTDLVFEPDPALRESEVIWVVAYIDRDSDGVFLLGEGADETGRRADGSVAAGSAAVTVVLLEPAAIVVADASSEGGDAIVISEVVLPAPGFVELLGDANGAPGETLAVSNLLGAGNIADLEFAALPPIEEDTTYWVRVRIDFDGDGVLGFDDPVALDEPNGQPVEDSFTVTFVPPVDDEDTSDS